MKFKSGDFVEFKTSYMVGQIVGDSNERFDLYNVRLSTPTGMQLIFNVRDTELEPSAWKKQAPPT